MAYATGYAQGRTGMLLHADGWVLNHGHTCMTDLLGVRPKFDRLRNELIAAGQIERLDLAGGVFSPGGPRPTTVLDSDTLVAKMAYCMMQPVRHGLVASARDQELFYCTRIADLERVRTIERPSCLENDDGESEYPEEVQLVYTAPPGWECRLAELRATLARTCGLYVSAAAAQRSDDKQPAPTVERALSVDPESRPNRPRRATDESDFLPRVAGGTRKERVALVNAEHVFEQAYRKALFSYRRGRRKTPFPRGTYAMRRRFNVRVADDGY